MDRETIAMSHKELDRVGVIRKVLDRELKQAAAAQQLGLRIPGPGSLPKREPLLLWEPSRSTARPVLRPAGISSSLSSL